MPAKGQPERLSKLQREILKVCKQHYEKDKKYGDRIRYFWLSKHVAMNMGRINKQYRGYRENDLWTWTLLGLSFAESFSRSIRNLIKKGYLENKSPRKGFVCPLCGRDERGDNGSRITYMRLTDKGKNLMLNPES